MKSSTKQQRGILVGPGKISTKYVQACQAIDEVKIVGVVSRNYERARYYAKEMNIQYSGVSLEEVAKKSDATMVIVCTPNGAHREVIMKAVAQGLHVLCEKPLEISYVAQEEILTTCRDSGVKLTVSFLYRFLPHMQEIRQLIQQGSFGIILSIDARLAVWRDSDYYSQSSWHGTEVMDGGGAFIQQGSHIVDMANWLAGGYHKVDCARRYTMVHPIPVEDHGYATVRYESGAVGMLECSTISRGMNVQEISITGTRGSARVSLTGILEWSVESTPPPKINDKCITKDFLFQELLKNFSKAIDQNLDPFITSDSAVQTGNLIFEIYRVAGPSVHHINKVK